MPNVRSNILIVVLMLVSFFGQAMAYSVTVPCDMSADTHSSIEHATQDKHDSTGVDDSDCCKTDCCDINCICAANGCSSSVYLNTEMSPRNLTMIYSAIDRWQAKQPTSISSLLYRPPIFTS